MADLSKARHSAVHAMPTLGQKLRKLVGGGGGKRSTGKEEKRGWGRRKPAEWHAPPDVFELKLDFGSLEDLEKELERGEGFWKGFDAGEVKPVAKAEKPEVKKEERVERREERRETPVTPVKRTEDRPRKSPAPARPANARYPTLTLPEAPRGRPRDFEATRSPPRAQPQQASQPRAQPTPVSLPPIDPPKPRHSIRVDSLLKPLETKDDKPSVIKPVPNTPTTYAPSISSSIPPSAASTATTFPSYRAPTTTASNRHSIADPTLLATRARQPSPAGARSVSATRPAPSQTPTLRTTPSAARLSERLSWLRELEAKNGSAGSRPAELQKLQGGVAAKLARFEGVAAQAGPQRGLVRTGSVVSRVSMVEGLGQGGEMPPPPPPLRRGSGLQGSVVLDGEFRRTLEGITAKGPEVLEKRKRLSLGGAATASASAAAPAWTRGVSERRVVSAEKEMPPPAQKGLDKVRTWDGAVGRTGASTAVPAKMAKKEEKVEKPREKKGYQGPPRPRSLFLSATEDDMNVDEERIVPGVVGKEIVEVEEKVEEKAEPVEESKPVEETKLVEEPTPVEESKPVEETKLVEEPKPVEEIKPVEEPKLVEETKPVEEPKPVIVTQSAEDTKPVEPALPSFNAASLPHFTSTPQYAPVPMKLRHPPTTF